MVTIGVDPHKDTHQSVAVADLGKLLAEREAPGDHDGFAFCWPGLETEHRRSDCG
jgi:hypothetical protein